jgi:hypothetical protein
MLLSPALGQLHGPRRAIYAMLQPQCGGWWQTSVWRRPQAGKTVSRGRQGFEAFDGDQRAE